MDFSIIIVTYNSSNYIGRCIQSIEKYKQIYDLEIIIIDNNSTDDTKKILKNFPDCTFVNLKKNTGFSHACNYGAALAQGKHIYFCNPDTVVENDIFHRANYFLSDNKYGCFSPGIVDFNKKEQPFAFLFPHNPLNLIWAYIRYKFKKQNPVILQLNLNNTSEVIECDWVLGACMIIPKNIFKKIEGFDENFFLYFEDVDICKRIKLAGYSIIADRTVYIAHKKYGSSENLDQKKIKEIRRRSQLTYYKKHYKKIGFLVSKFLDKNEYLYRA